MKFRRPRELAGIYQKLFKKWGPQKWWPATSRFEMMVGALLTQNTAWTNVEKAIFNLKKRKLLNVSKILNVPENILAQSIRPAGYFNLKAKRIKNFVCWYADQSIARLKKIKLNPLRKMFLDVNGIGPETADSMLLYGLGKRTFVVDTYTKRIFNRHGFFDKSVSYDEVKEMFEHALPRRAMLYNEFHALIVKLGKEYCRPKALCKGCPLEEDLHLFQKGECLKRSVK